MEWNGYSFLKCIPLSPSLDFGRWHGYLSYFCMDLLVSIFFSIHSSCPYWREFWERLYGVWYMREDMNEWMVWKCYPSGVEVLAYGGGVYVILDHESMKRNSQRSQNLTKLKMTQAAYNKMVSLLASCIWLW